MTLLEILIIAVFVGYVVSGIDDLIFDLVYWTDSGRRDRRLPLLSEDDLRAVPAGKAAIMIPAWNEENVIDGMVRVNHARIRYPDYDIFIGTYPNDLPTRSEALKSARALPNVYVATAPHAGPTNKADNLNSIMAEIVRQEERSGQRYSFIMMHDPEDVIHPHELGVVNWHLRSAPDVHMIQIPIHPLPARARQFTEGAYLDEFAEVHTKDIHVREWLTGFVPSAGVATAFRREVLDRLAEDRGRQSRPRSTKGSGEAGRGVHAADGKVFGTDSLTEDYDFGLRLTLNGLKSLFVRQFILDGEAPVDTFAIRPGRFDLIRDALPQERSSQLVATRADFPSRFWDAVRQRTRWTLGIVFQSWRAWGWPGPKRMRWILCHDRKGPFSLGIVVTGYLLIIALVAYALVRAMWFPDWPAAVRMTPFMGTIAAIGFSLFGQRLLQRAIATTRIYGWRQGLLSIPRQPWANLINVIASFRASKQFATAQLGSREIRWDKTAHTLPEVAAAVLRQPKHDRRRRRRAG